MLMLGRAWKSGRALLAHWAVIEKKIISIVNHEIFLITGYLARTINASLKTMGFYMHKEKLQGFIKDLLKQMNKYLHTGDKKMVLRIQNTVFFCF